jgi:ribonuclease BN (tRNA processing enzyme)
LYLEIHGARGSMPVGTGAFTRYGGDTTCYSLHHDDGELITIIDAGTGLRLLYPRLDLPGATIPIMVTHYHWDHIQGLSMCAPMWRGDVALQIMGPGEPKESIGRAISPPWFPVPITDMKVEFDQTPESFSLGEVSVTSFPLNHPQGGLGYRFDHTDESIVVATDHEAGTSADRILCDVSQGADLLVHDAQYLPEEIESKRGWGHSTWEQAAKVAADAGVGRLLFASHDPSRTDDQVDQLLDLASQSFGCTSAASPGERFTPK